MGPAFGCGGWKCGPSDLLRKSFSDQTVLDLSKLFQFFTFCILDFSLVAIDDSVTHHASFGGVEEKYPWMKPISVS